MAITRRQFVTTLGALAAAMGVGQADISQITEAFAHGSVWAAGRWTSKPKVIWVHGAECTGCSTSLLACSRVPLAKRSRAAGRTFPVQASRILRSMLSTSRSAARATVPRLRSSIRIRSTEQRLGISSARQETSRSPHVNNSPGITGRDFDNDKNGMSGAGNGLAVNIADVLIDFIDLQYHETVMGMGGDLAYQWLADNMYNGSKAAFVLVVEGAIQPKRRSAATGTEAPWCSIGKDGVVGHDCTATSASSLLTPASTASTTSSARLADQDACASRHRDRPVRYVRRLSRLQVARPQEGRTRRWRTRPA